MQDFHDNSIPVKDNGREHVKLEVGHTFDQSTARKGRCHARLIGDHITNFAEPQTSEFTQFPPPPMASLARLRASSRLFRAVDPPAE